VKADFERKLLPVLRLLVCGSRGPLKRSQYLRLLFAQDRVLLRLLVEFGRSSPAELREAARHTRPKLRFQMLSDETVADWLVAAERRALVEPCTDEGGVTLWGATAEGRLNSRGWRRHFESFLGTLVAFVKWLVPLVLGSAILGLLGHVDWKEVMESSAPSIALVAGLYALLILVYTAFVRFVQSLSALQLIELSRVLKEPLPLYVDAESPLATT
jgi:hypothetical protein